MPLRHPIFILCSLAVAMAACGETAVLPESAGIGPNPQLPEPKKETIPSINIAPAVGWAKNATPKAGDGLAVAPFATGLEHPRWMLVLPNGDVLVAETNAPPKPQDNKGVRGFFMKKTMAKAGAAVPSANRITLLRDADGDGKAEIRTVFLDQLKSPFGMALVGKDLYVANTDALVKFAYTEGATRLEGKGSKVADLPGGELNHHWTKNVIANADGSKLYVTVGSNSNVAEHGMAVESERAAIWEIDAKTGEHRVYASGLRNPNGMAWTGKTLWTVVNERDEIGPSLVPDYLTSVRDGGFYGWPYSYYGQHVDQRVKPQAPDKVAAAIVPDYALGPHTASLGLASAQGAQLPPPYASGMFVGQHGSWNRKPLSGYKVLFVPFQNEKPAGPPREVLTGFVNAEGEAQGRPVGVAVDKRGALLVADDVGNTIWRVTAATAAQR